jgi:hypothetical protein
MKQPEQQNGARLPRRLALAVLAAAGVIATLAILPAERVTAQAADQVGQWSAVQTWPIVSVHTHVLPSGRVMFYAYSDGSRLWNPADNSITSLPNAGYNIFCTGHSFIGDGRLFVTGGHIENNRGLNDASYYDFATNTWTRLPDMNDGRWYPTNNTLANGDVLVTSGDRSAGGVNDLPQVWQVGSGSWRNLTSAVLSLPLYPASFLAPNGRVFFATSPSRYLDTSGTGAWSSVASRLVGGRDNYGSAAMYDVGKVIYTGGADPPVSSAEIIDLNAPTPAWSYTGAMPQARRQHNLTILPDGKLLVTGGSASSGFNTVDGGKAAYMWDPATGSWTTMASESRYRGYHSTAVLLPDGRVLSSGGDNEPNAQVYSPPYLFKGARPAISSAPTSVSYGQTFFVGSPDATSITHVNWIRLSSVTHTKNMDQRINRLAFSQASGGLNVTAPGDPNLCPPGYYMLFILNGTGVPSVASMVRISGSPPPAPSAPSSLTATAVSSSRIDLAWTDNSGNEDGFRIERSTDGTNFAEIATVGANATTYASTGLAASTTYHYRVRAYNAGGNSAYSNTASATTQAGATAPNAPSNLTATAVSRSQINLAWTDNSNNEDGFKVERSTNGSSFTQIATVGANVTSYASTGLQKNKTYYYRVRAYNASGDSAYSNTASARTPRN